MIIEIEVSDAARHWLGFKKGERSQISNDALLINAAVMRKDAPYTAQKVAEALETALGKAG